MLVDLVATELADHGTALEHDHTRRALDDVLQLRGDQHDPAALVGELLDERLHLRLGTDVDASGRLVEQQDLRIGAQEAGEQRLLLVAARQLADVLAAAGRLDAETGDELADEPVDAAAGR